MHCDGLSIIDNIYTFLALCVCVCWNFFTLCILYFLSGYFWHKGDGLSRLAIIWWQGKRVSQPLALVVAYWLYQWEASHYGKEPQTHTHKTTMRVFKYTAAERPPFSFFFLLQSQQPRDSITRNPKPVGQLYQYETRLLRNLFRHAALY